MGREKVPTSLSQISRFLIFNQNVKTQKNKNKGTLHVNYPNVLILFRSVVLSQVLRFSFDVYERAQVPAIANAFQIIMAYLCWLVAQVLVRLLHTHCRFTQPSATLAAMSLPTTAAPPRTVSTAPLASLTASATPAYLHSFRVHTCGSGSAAVGGVGAYLAPLPLSLGVDGLVAVAQRRVSSGARS